MLYDQKWGWVLYIETKYYPFFSEPIFECCISMAADITFIARCLSVQCTLT